MTAILLISSLILYILADYYQSMYNYTGKIKYSEVYKICFVGCVLSAIMIPPEPVLLLVWILWHYPTQQIGQGWLRHGKPLYLGSGDFDKFVRKWTFGKDWIYIVSLVASLILGTWLYLL